MSFLDWFSNREVAEFGRGLADTLAKRYPAALEVNPEKKISQARLTQVIEETLRPVAEFQRERKLGMFGKARLGNQFKWRLRDLGYTEKFIEVATEGLMVHLTRGAQTSGPAGTGKR